MLDKVKIGSVEYVNQLTALPLTQAMIESKLSTIGLRFSSPIYGKKEPLAEYFPAPSFTHSFWQMVQNNGNIPSQEEFVKYYLKENAEEITSTCKKKYPYKYAVAGFFSGLMCGLEARARRTYPSLVRDLLFAVSLKEQGFDVFWNPIVDVEHGMDLVIKHNDVLYGIALYTNTRRGNAQRARKLGEKTMPSGFEPVELSINLDDGKHIGAFKVYGETQIQELKELLKN